MQQQVDINDCGLFATACAFELYKNKNPAKIYFKQSIMVEHYDISIVNQFFHWETYKSDFY